MKRRDDLKQLSVNRKDGVERFCLHGRPLSLCVLDFWRWCGSDLLDNTMRGILAEFIVGYAVNAAQTTRLQWEAFDAVTPNGIRIEVKSSAYLQSWHQRGLSKIAFSIRSSKRWDAKTNALLPESKRHSDAYVFCLLAHRDKASVDPSNLDQWEFFVVSTKKLNAVFPNRKSLSLAALEQLQPAKVKFDGIATAAQRLGK